MILNTLNSLNLNNNLISNSIKLSSSPNSTNLLNSPPLSPPSSPTSSSFNNKLNLNSFLDDEVYMSNINVANCQIYIRKVKIEDDGTILFRITVTHKTLRWHVWRFI